MLRRLLRKIFGRRSLLLSMAHSGVLACALLGAISASAAENAPEKPPAAPTKAPKAAPAGKEIKVSGTVDKGLAVEAIHIVPRKSYSELRRLMQAAASKAQTFESAEKRHAAAQRVAEQRGKEAPPPTQRDKARAELDAALEKIDAFVTENAGETLAGPKEEALDKARKIEGGDVPQDSLLFHKWTRKEEKVLKSSFGVNTTVTVRKGLTVVRAAASVTLAGKGEITVAWVDESSTGPQSANTKEGKSGGRRK
ncbi:MAG: hypothetical protein LBG65_03700 [Puniceicoccales bacterium]|jgi:hypothetical protein|nr:hypothetical protein [Puniceicoccales bacterium]